LGSAQQAQKHQPGAGARPAGFWQKFILLLCLLSVNPKYTDNADSRKRLEDSVTAVTA